LLVGGLVVMVADAPRYRVIQRGGRCGAVVCSLLWFPPAGRGGVGRTRWQLQLLFFIGNFDVVFGVASLGALLWRLLAIAPPSHRTKSL
jgi:hypothetical protein